GAIALNNLGITAAARGDYKQATALSREGLALCRKMDDRRGAVWCLHGLAWAAAGQGRAERAVRLLGAAEAIRKANGGYLPPGMQSTSEQTLNDLRASLTAQTYTAAWATGQTMTLEQTIADALEEPGAAAPAP